ncbi:hypothetical protein RBH26_11070 [Natronolimnohabitans sp. A-GB9]|uniref:hypothetical protein n=1 Tax=Natronolimnohabitans sp. A-GB9 TaxID=3069757 RepID=UPI0027AEA04B|nr:hypothetical protein [Natronolimnohabitans sp. A-GB9]MDQ2051021.1 hypothetical protein [Natronolimnohabitans sp. A-GB9]
MKRTRRAALALIAGSSSVLAVDTLGSSSTKAEREFTVDTVGDRDAYLGLTADGLEDGGVLFEGAPRRPPTEFTVTNQVAEPITVDLALEGSGVRLERGDDAGTTDRMTTTLVPGERSADLAVDFDWCEHVPLDGEREDATLTVTAEGDSTLIEAARPFTLESNVVARISVLESAVIVVRHVVDDGKKLIRIETTTCLASDSRFVTDVPCRPEQALRLDIQGLTELNESGRPAATAASTRSDHGQRDKREIDTRAAGDVAVDVETEPNSRSIETESETAVDHHTGTARSVVVEVDPDTTVETETTTTIPISLAQLDDSNG